MREVQDAARDELRRSVRVHAAELRAHERDRLRRRDGQLDSRVSQDLQLGAVGRRPLEDERSRLVLALVPRRAEGQVGSAPDRAGDADVSAHGQRVAVGRDGIGQLRDAGLGGHGWPRLLRPPPSVQDVGIGAGRARFAHEDPHHRLAVHAVVLVGEPATPPPDHLGHVVDPGAGQRVPRAHVAPRSEQELPGSAQTLERPERHVVIPVGVPGDDHGRGPDPLVAAERHGAVPPVRILVLFLEPPQLPGVGIDAAEPLVAPALAVDGRHRRQRVHGDHDQRVVEEVEAPADAAAEVDVVGVAAVGRVDRDDRLQRGRLERGHLQGVEPAVRRPVHADGAVRPLLLCEPRDHDQPVVPLPLRVLVGSVAARRAGAADVGAADREPSLVAEPPVDRRRVRDVVLAVRPRLEHHRPRRRHVVRQMQREGDPHAVVHLEEPQLVRHGREPTRADR